MIPAEDDDTSWLDPTVDHEFEMCAAFTRSEEGGYVDDPRDSGNWTGGAVGAGSLIGSNMGVGAPELATWLKNTGVTAAIMRTLPATIYNAMARARYWTPMSCADMPAGVDLMLFDYGWNRGVGSSILLLQQVLGVKEDGICGRATVRAAHARQCTDLINEMANGQNAAYRVLHNFNVYGHGWLARTDRRRETALRCQPADIKRPAKYARGGSSR